VIRWEPEGPYRVVFSTRVGGVSEGAFDSLNLGRLTADEPQRVDENRQRLLREVGAAPERLTLNRQTHSALVHRARAGVRGEPGDGLWTDEPGVPLLALAADCLPVALVRRGDERPAVAVLHVGWRGLLGGIVVGSGAAAVDAEAAAIGPGIGPCCFEVGDEVAGPFAARYGHDVLRGRNLDLWTAAERALRRAGVASVERVDLCTCCNPELFFSHRRSGRQRGVQGLIGAVA